MGFLGFRRQAWKNPDAEVRLRAVPEMGADHQGAFRDLALTDPDPRVRAATARRVTVGEALQVLATKGDDAVRRIAKEKLAGVAESIVRTKPLAECRTLLEQINDQKSLADLTLHAVDEGVRAAAWERLRTAAAPSQAMLATIAIQDANGVRGRAAVALLERKMLKDVARKAKHVDVRAAAETALAVQKPEETKPSTDRQHQARKVALDELLGAATRLGVAAEALPVLAKWTDLDTRLTTVLAIAPDVDTTDITAQLERYARLKRESLARAESEKARITAARAARMAVISELLTKTPAPALQAGALAARAPWRARWAALVSLPADEVSASEQAFAQALERAFPVEEPDPEIVVPFIATLPPEQVTALEALASEAATLAASDDHQRAVHGFQLLHKRWLAIAADLPFDHPLRQAFPRAYADFKQRRQDERNQRQAAYQDALRDFRALVIEAEQLVAQMKTGEPAAEAFAKASPVAAQVEAAAETVAKTEAPAANAEADALAAAAADAAPAEATGESQASSVASAPAKTEGRRPRAPKPLSPVDQLKSIQARSRKFGMLKRGDAAPLRARLQHALDTAWEPLRQEREAEDWERFANLAKAEELIAYVEGATVVEDFPKLANIVKRAHLDWKRLGPLPRDRQQPTWTRFKAACDVQFDRCKPFFAEQDAARAQSLERKRALLAEAESLANRPAIGLAGSVADMNARRETSVRFKAMQVEWRACGPAPREFDQDLWNRFRTACDGFFRLQQADSQLRAQEMTANLEKKQALCAEVEAFAELAKASRAWREENAAAIAAAAAATAENPRKPTKGPKAPPGNPDPADVAAQAKEFQARWKELGHVPREQVEAIWARFRTACDAVWDSIEDHRKAQEAERQANLERKKALIKEMDDILAHENPQWFKHEVKELQDQWRAIGYVPREAMDTLNREFHDRCAKVMSL